MASKRQKKRKHKRTPARSSIRKDILAAATFTSFFMIMIAGFISAELAVVIMGLLAVAFAAVFEKRRRSFWEQAQNFKLKEVQDSNEKLEREVERNRSDIAKLKEGMAEAAQSIEKESRISRPENPALAALADKLETLAAGPRTATWKASENHDFDLRTMPGAIKPLKPKKMKKKPSIKAANDEELAYYESLSDTVVKELLRHAVNTKNIHVFVQPVMRLPQRQAKFFEMFARVRIKPGLYLPATRYLKVARREKLINDIDDLLLMQCLETIKHNAHKEQTTPFFLNISSGTLKNMSFMRRLLGFINVNRNLASKLVFEIRQQDFDDMQPALLEILRGLGKLGCSLSLDHITHEQFDIALLQAMKVRFIKFNASELLAKAREKKGATDIWRMKRKLEGNGIGFVVEKIESEYMLKELLDFDINYGQGFHLGKPDLQGAYKEAGSIKAAKTRKTA